MRWLLSSLLSHHFYQDLRLLEFPWACSHTLFCFYIHSLNDYHLLPWFKIPSLCLQFPDAHLQTSLPGFSNLIFLQVNSWLNLPPRLFFHQISGISVSSTAIIHVLKTEICEPTLKDPFSVTLHLQWSPVNLTYLTVLKSTILDLHFHWPKPSSSHLASCSRLLISF